MTKFTTHTKDTAPAEALPFLEGAEKDYKFVPNLYAKMSEAPILLEGYITLSHIFDKSTLTATEKQIILMTNNRLNGCEYCMAAHTSIAQGYEVPADVIESLRKGNQISDPKLEALRQFSEIINLSRGRPTDDDISAFIAAGYSKQTVLEVLVATSLKVMSNYTNHIAETPLDEAFVPNTWTAANAG